MARKFVDLEEAAKLLGVTPDTLNEMRERREIYGYRDGGSWKFKGEDIDKAIADRATAEQEGEFAELDEDPDSILLSEVELGGSGESTSSTIIGGRSSKKNAAESDIQLAQPKPESDIQAPSPSKPSVLAKPLVPPEPESDELEIERPKHDSDLNLDAALDMESQSGGSDVLSGGSGVSPMFDDLDALDLEMPSAADSGISSNVLSDAKPGKGSGGGSALELGEEAGTSDIMLGSDAIKLEGSNMAFGADDELELGEAPLGDSKAGGSAIDLAEDFDDDLVLGGSSHGDLSRSGDSGISLLDPADSGLSLESAPLELGGSAVESLELGEDEMLGLDEPAAKSGATAGEAQSDDDFLLTPLEEAGAEESDSGSQVIALEGDVEFEEMAGGGVSTLDDGGGMGGLLEEDLGEGLGAAASLGSAAAATSVAQMAAAGPAGVLQAPEPPYSGWNVASLIMCSLLLMFSGMFMYDLMRNMWSWNGPYSVNSSMMDLVLSWFEK